MIREIQKSLHTRMHCPPFPLPENRIVEILAKPWSCGVGVEVGVGVMGAARIIAGLAGGRVMAGTGLVHVYGLEEAVARIHDVKVLVAELAVVPSSLKKSHGKMVEGERKV